MGRRFHLKKLPDKELINEASIETGIDPAFLEKDWYAVQLLLLLSAFESDKNVRLVFSGGTSLSKGYGIIKRFSEDIDFILCLSQGHSLSVGQRRAFRKEILSAISAEDSFKINEESVLRGDNHRFFKVPIQYSRIFDGASLRPYLQLEMTFSDLNLPAQERPISSILSEVARQAPELRINCVSPLETAGDKLSAFTWRILVRNRSDAKDDPTVIRHLHDIAALEQKILDSQKAFIQTAQISLEHDRTRRGGKVIENLSASERLSKALDMLQKDPLYRKEYARFVDSMSYADEKERINFDRALLGFEKLIAMFS